MSDRPDATDGRAAPGSLTAASRLVLGGHSFISQLGSDPAASERERLEIVAACLDLGIRRFDTTYQPERTALGSALATLGRRDEAQIFAWNFFSDFAAGEPVGKAAAYQPHHIELILEQLRTDYLDGLVVVPSADDAENRRQAELLTEWQRQGRVRSLGLWVEDPARLDPYHETGCFSLAIRPFNVTSAPAAVETFAAYRQRGWETWATSPFFRGWELERIVAAGLRRGLATAEELRTTLADLMLRYALFDSTADRLVVAMRRNEWIGRNCDSAARGPLGADERRLLRDLRRLAEKRWWQKLRRPKLLRRLSRASPR